MRRSSVTSVAMAVLLLAIGSGASAQSGSTLTIFGNGHFKGRSISLSGPLQNIDPVFLAKSVEITGGGAWELCSGSTYTGCRAVNASVTAGIFSVRSARPIAPVVKVSVGTNVPNQSLRGVASEFFVAPTRGTQRVGVAENKPEAMRRAAQEFCGAAGWSQVAHAQLQDVGGAFYLVDVLCANSAN